MRLRHGSSWHLRFASEPWRPPPSSKSWLCQCQRTLAARVTLEDKARPPAPVGANAPWPLVHRFRKSPAHPPFLLPAHPGGVPPSPLAQEEWVRPGRAAVRVDALHPQVKLAAAEPVLGTAQAVALPRAALKAPLGLAQEVDALHR